MKKIALAALAVITVASCKNETKKVETQETEQAAAVEVQSPVQQMLENVEQAHNKKAFLDKEMVQFDINLSFGGQTRLDGTVTMSTDSRFIRVDKKDGTSIVYDGENVWITPQDADLQGARFDIFTWSYFFALPYKLSDPGTITELVSSENNQEVIRLSFEQGTGDAPDDWYEIYVNDQTNAIDYAGYIVTYGGTSVDQAAQNAHAIGYDEFKTINGIPIAHEWKFYNYQNTVDTSTVIGNASLTNLSFSTIDKSKFLKPEKATQVTL